MQSSDASFSQLSIYTCLVLPQLIWSGMHVFSKYFFKQGVHPFVLPMFRTCLSIPFFYIACYFRNELDSLYSFNRSHIKMGVILGTLGYCLNQHTVAVGLAVSTASDAGIFMPLMTVLATVAAILLKREMYSHKKAVAVLLAVIGSILIVMGELYFTGKEIASEVDTTNRIIGIIAYISNTVVGAAWVIYQKPYLEVFTPFALAFWSCIFGSIWNVIIAAFFVNQMDWASISALSWAGIGYAAIFSTFAASVLYSYAVKYLPGSIASMGICFQPLFSCLLGFIILGETISAFHAFGGLVIIAGVYLIVKSRSEELALTESLKLEHIGPEIEIISPMNSNEVYDSISSQGSSPVSLNISEFYMNDSGELVSYNSKTNNI